jgi:hypothetical protein
MMLGARVVRTSGRYLKHRPLVSRTWLYMGIRLENQLRII